MASDPDPLPAADDPLVAEYVEKALALVRDRVPPDHLEVYRLRLYLFYETNPVAVKLLDEIREAKRQLPVVARSAEVARRDDAQLEDAARHRRARRAGK